jgi:hypothetical protein
MKTKNKISFVVLLALLINTSLLYPQDKAVTQTKELQQKTTPSDALQMLKDGNQRFTSGKMLTRDLMGQAKATARAVPYAVVLSCIDSRVAPEIAFTTRVSVIFLTRALREFCKRGYSWQP